MLARCFITLCAALGLPLARLAAQEAPRVFRSVAEAMASKEPVLILDLSGQSLTEVPEDLWKLRGLEQLHLNDNQLHLLPSQIGRLRKLKVLDLAHNRLAELPSQLCQLSRLESIRIAGNPVASPPPCLDRLPRLIRYEILPPMPDSQRTHILDAFFNQGEDMFIFATEEPLPLNSQTLGRYLRQIAPASGRLAEEKIVLRILVSQEGQYLTHRVVSGAGAHRLPQIEAALPMLSFRPAYLSAEPIAFWVNVDF